MQKDIQPSWFLLINSSWIIILCIFLFSIMLGGIIVGSNPLLVIAVPFIMLPSVWLACKTYQSVFRRNANAARHTGNLLYTVGGFILFGVVTNFGEGLFKSSEISSTLFLVCGCFFLFGVYVIYCGRKHKEWAKEIVVSRKLSGPDDVVLSDSDKQKSTLTNERTPPIQFSLGELLGFVTIVAIISSITTWIVRSTPPMFIEHATPEQSRLSLPKGASDVCCARGYGRTITYEFSIDEAGFFEWAKSSADTLESEKPGNPTEVIVKPLSLSRYTNLGSNSTSAKEDIITITNGYYHSWEDKYPTIIFAYDKDNQRAYFHRSASR